MLHFDRDAMMTELNATDGLKRSSEEENMKKNEDNVKITYRTYGTLSFVCVCVCVRVRTYMYETERDRGRDRERCGVNKETREKKCQESLKFVRRYNS